MIEDLNKEPLTEEAIYEAQIKLKDYFMKEGFNVADLIVICANFLCNAFLMTQDPIVVAQSTSTFLLTHVNLRLQAKKKMEEEDVKE